MGRKFKKGRGVEYMYTYSWFTGLYSRNRHNIIKQLYSNKGFPGSSAGKESACNVGDLGSIPGLEDPLEEGMATYSSILAGRIHMDRGAWRATVHGVAKSWTQLSD